MCACEQKQKQQQAFARELACVGPGRLRSEKTTSLDIQHGGDIFVGDQLDQDNVVEVTLKCQNVVLMRSLVISSEDVDYFLQLFCVQSLESEKVGFVF